MPSAPSALRNSQRIWRRRLRWAVPLMALLVSPLLWKLFGPRGFIVTVESKTWLYQVEIEKRILETGSGWCDELPASAIDIQRRVVDGREHCRYSAPEWRRRWVRQATGSEAESPHWPALPPGDLTRDAIGAERPGKRTMRFLLHLSSAVHEQQWDCELPRELWERVRLGETFRLRVDRFSTADCSSVPLR
ncbi:hypothetical protein [Pelomonas sp. KK5]|uniref:hypothetical protein n=1 Tax=Pelomonas sp. KK5 TaxID=1855730 RepID=UPI00118143AA|nr:hypothetical protein [Pelomonas sp. KK5]